ncbi:hypothetical protein HDU93_006297, partial [Gonapodya sp. JEL0774]
MSSMRCCLLQKFASREVCLCEAVKKLAEVYAARYPAAIGKVVDSHKLKENFAPNL